MKASLLVGIVLSGVAATLGFVSTAIPYWRTLTVNSNSTHAGLWQLCTSDLTPTTCTEFEVKHSSHWFRTCEALAIIGILCLALATVLAVCYAKNEPKTRYLAFAALNNIIGGVFFIVAVIIYAVYIKRLPAIEDSVWSVGFYLALLASVAAFLATFAMFYSKKSAGYTSIVSI